ncbi:unnamed protein product [Orchesella dallaii]|uniref:Odorant receptor n=1 Tax=Orchesella dallaii TaxID=48710 RepID=A0ABP1R6K0_9HEXA
MALAKAATNVQFLIQKYSIFPPFPGHLIADGPLNEIKMSHVPFTQQKFAKPFWKFISYGFKLIFLLTLWRIRELVSNWKTNTDMEQLVTLLLLLSMALASYTMYYYFEHFNAEYSYLITQVCQQFIMLKHSTDDKEIKSFSKRFTAILRVEKLGAMVYIISFSFVCFPAAATVFPFVTDFEPLQIILREFCNFMLPIDAKFACKTSKIFAMFIYIFYALHAGAVTVYFNLLFVCLGGCVLRLSTGLKLEANATINQDFVVTPRAFIKLQKCIKLYRILQIITSISRQITKDIFGVLFIMCALLAASSAYFVIYLYSVVLFIMYLACAFLAVFIFAFSILLITLASLPYAHTTLFKQRWRWIRVSKRLRLQLESCGAVGFSLGNFVRIATAHTSMYVTDIYLNCVATMALMGDFQRL